MRHIFHTLLMAIRLLTSINGTSPATLKAFFATAAIIPATVYILYLDPGTDDTRYKGCLLKVGGEKAMVIS
jgi:hypothetical protein